jgi:hypothetical protein
MNEKTKVVDRGALYYPFIHVRDDNWLKATLLCFPFVDRMVPKGYEVNDGDVASFFAKAAGRSGRSMLGRRDVGDPATEHARMVLLAKLTEDVREGRVVDRFSRQAARRRYEDGDNSFQIHEYKIGSALVDFLRTHDLAWAPTNPVRGNARWWAVHPVLGEAIMSTNAVALANAHDLEIVTNDGPIHQSLLGSTADTVYDVLIRQQLFGLPRPTDEKVNDLVRFVIVSGFDLEKLSLEDVAELNQSRGDLSALKSELLAQLDDVGDVPDRDAWNDLLSVRAKEVVNEWSERSSLKSLVRKADAGEIADDLKGSLQEIAPSVVTGGFATALVGAVPGLVVGVIIGAVQLVMKWRQSQRPYRFLSRLEKKGARPRHVLECSPV